MPIGINDQQLCQPGRDVRQTLRLAKLEPMPLRQISVVNPFTLSSDYPTFVFSSSARFEWCFDGYDLGEITYRVHFDTQRDFARAGQGTTRLAKLDLPPDFPHGPVYWNVEAIDRNGQLMATSDDGYFEFYENSNDRIRRTGGIRIGVACSVEEEFSYFDNAQRRLTGFDIELAHCANVSGASGSTASVYRLQREPDFRFGAAQ